MITDGRHAKVEYTNNWLEDASRRDLTINAIYSDIDGDLLIHSMEKRFKIWYNQVYWNPAKNKEDYLRILRYIRFFLVYSKNQYDRNLVKIIKQNLSGLKKVSKERQLQELRKIIFVDTFNKINSDKISIELFLLIFPELKHINRINKLDSFKNEI